jgi:hypothetical protein
MCIRDRLQEELQGCRKSYRVAGRVTELQEKLQGCRKSYRVIAGRNDEATEFQ